ncbi:hypothetical protein NECAME_10318 [Necator americanus]|uniref:Uncharacterized protein n=1 Tax=Necator americanus TaxID=51031 RepID=W2TA80_NECAM|nr:hypothetical protein NECAME_10318 [Necator americanus]ETN78499.1 hypothetical protein NECAME_10318 [Necator americanus]
MFLANGKIAAKMGVERVSREQALSILLLHTLHTMLLCCCWPVHKCVTINHLVLEYKTVVIPKLHFAFGYVMRSGPTDGYMSVEW